MKKFLVLFCWISLMGVSAQASDPYFLACYNTEYRMELNMSFDQGGRMFTYTLSENGMPRGFYAIPGAGWGYDHSKVTAEWNSAGELEFKAQIMGGNALNPQFLYSADLKLKDLGEGNLKLLNIEVLNHERSQGLIWFYGLICKVHQGS